jgi:hypothetical protein
MHVKTRRDEVLAVDAIIREQRLHLGPGIPMSA